MSTMNPPKNDETNSSKSVSSGDGDPDYQSIPSTPSLPQIPSISHQITVSIPSTSGDSNLISETTFRNQESSSEERDISGMDPNVKEEQSENNGFSHQNPDLAPLTSNDRNLEPNIRNLGDAFREVERVDPSIVKSEFILRSPSDFQRPSTSETESFLHPIFHILTSVDFSSDPLHYQEVLSRRFLTEYDDETMSKFSIEIFIPISSSGALQSPDTSLHHPETHFSDDDPDFVATKNAVERIDNFDVENPPHPIEIVEKYIKWKKERCPGDVNINTIFGKSSRTISDYLVTPQPWDKCGKEKIYYLRMHNWFQIPDDEQEQIMKLKLNAYREKYCTEPKIKYERPRLPNGMRTFITNKFQFMRRPLKFKEMADIAISNNLNFPTVKGFCRHLEK
ncbi:hypothetical protein CRE_10775 [Caenorhabditis remanei]|uniref:CUT domain-containing protein n=1 Tax=Caenorhabditis remanei TaxID=31234 RepID=E3NUE3_CAERE|nr:hypothetical protein CRE_10775 [Caenorhabditis remanei]